MIKERLCIYFCLLSYKTKLSDKTEQTRNINKTQFGLKAVYTF